MRLTREVLASLRHARTELWSAGDLAGRIRRQPLVATGVATLAGLVGAPWLLRTLGLTAATAAREVQRRPGAITAIGMAVLGYLQREKR